MLFTVNINWKNIGILVAVSASFYATIFFIPASWITGLLNRRFWFWLSYHNLNLVKKYLNLTQELWWISQIIAGGLLYPLVVKKWGIHKAMMIAFSLRIVYFLLVTFTKIPELWFVGQLLNGLAFSIIFTIIFSLAIVWNYQISCRPVMGCFSALNALTTFIAQLVQRAISTNHWDLFNNINVDWNLPVVQDGSFNLNILHLMVMIILMVYLAITLLLMLFVFLTIKHLSGEYFSRENHNFDCRVLVGEIKPSDHLPGMTLSQWIKPDY